ncbi:MAG: sensor domain-containing diguanylate cyclase [Nitrospirota bacterium]
MKKIVAPGLALFFLIAGWGPFISRGLSNAWVFPWIAGYLFLVFLVSYEFVFSQSPILPVPFRFIALGVIFMNFIMQLTGGAHSTLWSAYYLFAVIFAALSRLPQALSMALTIIAVELASLLLSGQYDPARLQIYAGFGLSLIGVSAASSFIMGFVLKEAEQAKDAHDRLIEKAEAVNPLAAPAKLEMLMHESRQAVNLSTAQDLEEGFAGLFEMTRKLVPAHTYALFVKERRENSEVYVLRACRTESSGAVASVGTALDPAAGKTRIDLCAERRGAQYIPDLADMPLHSLGYYHADAGKVPVRSVMLIPLLSKDDDEGVIAVLAADRLAPDEFDEHDQEMLKHVAAFFRQYIEKTLTSLDLETKAAIFGGLHDISADLISSLKFDEIMEKVIPRIRQVVPFDLCACFLRTGTGSMPQVQVIALEGYGRGAIDRAFPVGESTVLAFMHKHWLEQGTSTFYTADYGDRIRDIELFPLKELQRPIRCLYGRLFVAGQDFLGAIFLASFRPDAFSESARSLLETLLNQVALVANNSHLHTKIENMARTDGLTGLLNHRTFMEMLHAKYRELERIPRPFSILLMDIDKFKGVNDKYGHPVGDIAIKAVARILHDTIRGTDFVARYGGEEFAVGMVETDRKGAELMAERVRSIMERTVVTRVFDGELKCTLSIGVATFPEDTEDRAGLVTMADDALYHAKRTGRNRVSLFRDAVKAPAHPAAS